MKDFHTIDLREWSVILPYFRVRSEIENLGDSKFFQGKFSCDEISLMMGCSKKDNYLHL